MRQNDDLNFATSLQRFHTIIPNSHDVDVINSKHIDFNIVTTIFEFKPILFTSNLLQVTFNYSCAKLFATQKEPPPI
jgi:hypothetical protein